MVGAPPAVTSKSSATNDNGFATPVKMIVGGELSAAVAVEPEKVMAQMATAEADRPLRSALCGVGAPVDVALMVAVTPVGNVDPVARDQVPAKPLDVGTARLLVVFGATGELWCARRRHGNRQRCRTTVRPREGKDALSGRPERRDGFNIRGTRRGQPSDVWGAAGVPRDVDLTNTPAAGNRNAL